MYEIFYMLKKKSNAIILKQLFYRFHKLYKNKLECKKILIIYFYSINKY